MNLITFNEHFAVVATSEGQANYEKACVAPMFEYTAVFDHVNEVIDAMKREDSDQRFAEFRMPFPILRMEIQLQNRPNGKPIGLRYQVMAFAKSCCMYFRVLDSKDRSKKNMLFCFELGGRNDGDFTISVWEDRRKQWEARVRSNISDPELGDTFYEVYKQLVGSIVAFCVDAMSPSSHLAAVTPDAPGRSVQWIKARQHYTFISHGHPANKAGIAPGSRVASDSEGELTRMAHNRRAHKKTLRHERYRYARGKTIEVRATWVGPKEWKDAGGKQIYRILEPSDWQP